MSPFVYVCTKHVKSPQTPVLALEEYSIEPATNATMKHMRRPWLQGPHQIWSAGEVHIVNDGGVTLVEESETIQTEVSIQLAHPEGGKGEGGQRATYIMVCGSQGK